MRIKAPLDAVGGARAAAAVSWTPQAGPGGFRFVFRAWAVGVCEVGLLWTPKASRGRRRRVLDAQGGARVAAGTGGMCRAAAGADGLGFVGLDLGLRVRGASPVSRGRRHLCARCGSTRELGVPCCISIWALGFASHRSLVHCLWSFVFRSALALSARRFARSSVGFGLLAPGFAVGFFVCRCRSCTSCRTRGPSVN